MKISKIDIVFFFCFSLLDMGENVSRMVLETFSFSAQQNVLPTQLLRLYYSFASAYTHRHILKKCFQHDKTVKKQILHRTHE